MPVQNLYAAESWDKIYQTFEQVNFTSYDYDTIKESLIQYMRLYYPEHFNDFIESSELVALIETFAITAEQMAYRVDMAMHENGMSTAERKQSILRLAKFISYNATRNQPARGLVKINSITSTERVIDSQGNNLQGRAIKWNDATNPVWKEQFYLVMNRVLIKQFGQPSKVFTVDDVEMQLYELGNKSTSFGNGVYPYTTKTNSETIAMELVSSDLDDSGPFERYVDGSSRMNILYVSDGLGDASDMTGFMMYTKQGSLVSEEKVFENPIPNRIIDVTAENVNNMDVWINQLDDSKKLTSKWEQVDSANQQNIFFNVNKNREKYEIETLENDRIRVIFGDGNFSKIPVGRFQFWTRTSLNRDIVIQKNRITNEPVTFAYRTNFDVDESCTLSFSLVNSLQNATKSEDIEHIRRNAPQTYYSQNRMVNGQDYNTLLLKDSSVLKLRAVNRTFSGQPKYQEWNDASGQYQNVKVFGDDVRVYYDFKQDSISTTLSTRNLINDVIEPLLESAGVQNIIQYQTAVNPNLREVRTVPRHKFVENSKLGVQEKTRIQGVLDSHYYGEPKSFKTIGNTNYAEVSTDTDFEIWDITVPRSVGGVAYNDGIPSGLQSVAAQPEFGIRFEPERAFERVDDDQNPLPSIELTVANFHTSAPLDEIWTIECINEARDGGTFAITGSISGVVAPYTIGDENYDNGFFTLNILHDHETHIDYVLGDTFIITSFADDGLRLIDIYQTNLGGRWVVINGGDLDKAPSFQLETAGYTTASDGPNSDNSWVIWVKKNLDEHNNIVDYTVTYRDLKTVIESPTTKFWYNNTDSIIDSNTKKRIRDNLSLLKSNLDKEGKFAIGTNIVFDVIGGVNKDDGTVNINSLEIFPKGNIDASALSEINRGLGSQFSDFVDIYDVNPQFTYFSLDVDGGVNPVDSTIAISSRSYLISGPSVSVDGLYERKIGRDSLDFLWQHFSPNSSLIDPSTSNIIDIFVLTKGYFQNVKSYIDGTNPFVPLVPSSLELRNSYRDILANKMMSDTVVMHSGRIKLLFGELADPQVRSKFRVIKSSIARMTDDQIKAEIMDVIELFFAIDNWDFGGTFHFTQLSTLIHQRLGSEIDAVVIVPTFVNNSFGNLFVIEAGEDEILQSAAGINDIEIVDTFTQSVLRQS